MKVLFCIVSKHSTCTINYNKRLLHIVISNITTVHYLFIPFQPLFRLSTVPSPISLYPIYPLPNPNINAIVPIKHKIKIQKPLQQNTLKIEITYPYNYNYQ